MARFVKVRARFDSRFRFQRTGCVVFLEKRAQLVDERLHVFLRNSTAVDLDFKRLAKIPGRFRAENGDQLGIILQAAVSVLEVNQRFAAAVQCRHAAWHVRFAVAIGEVERTRRRD